MTESISSSRSTGASSPVAPTPVSFQPQGLRPMDSPNAVPLFLDKRLLLSFNPLAGNRSGLQWSALRLLHIRGCVFRPCSASLALPAFHLVRPLLTSPRYSAPVARRPASILRSTGEISRGKTRYLHCIDAGFTKCTLHRRWRTSRSRARSSRMHHASYPVFVHRPAVLDWASFRPRLAATPLPFSLPSALHNLAIGLSPTK